MVDWLSSTRLAELLESAPLSLFDILAPPEVVGDVLALWLLLPELTIEALVSASPVVIAGSLVEPWDVEFIVGEGDGVGFV